jgi:hypothetical protein
MNRRRAQRLRTAKGGRHRKPTGAAPLRKPNHTKVKEETAALLDEGGAAADSAAGGARGIMARLTREDRVGRLALSSTGTAADD